MSKSKITVFLFIIILGLAAALLIYKTKAQNNYQSKVVLAKELRKAMDSMMNDFRKGKVSSVQGVPADGKWYHSIAFNTDNEGPIAYRLMGDAQDNLQRNGGGSSSLVAAHMAKLNLRRLPGEASIVEVQIQARNDAQLTSNFKIRFLD